MTFCCCSQRWPSRTFIQPTVFIQLIHHRELSLVLQKHNYVSWWIIIFALLWNKLFKLQKWIFFQVHNTYNNYSIKDLQNSVEVLTAVIGLQYSAKIINEFIVNPILHKWDCSDHSCHSCTIYYCQHNKTSNVFFR